MIPLDASTPPSSSEQLRRAHQRFGRAALALQLLSASVAVVLLVFLAATERDHENELRSARLMHETQLRARQLARQLGLVVGELRRLGLRSEVDLLDPALPPEQGLERLAHASSTFFNVGVTIVDRDGKVMRSEPEGIVPVGTSFRREPWFAKLHTFDSVAIVPVDPERAEDALIYVVSPVIRGGEFTGAIVGAIDLARAGLLSLDPEPMRAVQMLLATPDGRVVYPPTPPGYSRESGWLDLFATARSEPFTESLSVEGRRAVAAGAPVQGAELVLVSLMSQEALSAPARARMWTRLGLGLAIAVVPLGVLLWALGRSIRIFREAEQAAMRSERLGLVGEASNLIAHEVKNGLNGIRLGLELVTSGKGEASARVASQLREEVGRLTQFATDLMLFSRGVVPRPTHVDLARLIDGVVELAREVAAEAGVAVTYAPPTGPLEVRADPALVHTVVSNLITNSVDALTALAAQPPPEVKVSAGAEPSWVYIRVEDEGPGVAPAVRARLFEPFVTGKPNGVGIGLALSRQIARAHGGDLVLEDRAVGASFLFRLPRERA